MLKFPRIGSIVRRKLVGDDTPDDLRALYDGVEVEVELVGRETLLEWSATAMAHARAESARRALEGADSITIDGLRELGDRCRAIVVRSVKSVPGVQVGEIDLGARIDPKLLADLLEEAGLLVAVSQVAQEAQRPTPVQKKDSGSPPATEQAPS